MSVGGQTLVSIEGQAQLKEMLAVGQSWSGAELSVSYPTTLVSTRADRIEQSPSLSDPCFRQ